MLQEKEEECIDESMEKEGGRHEGPELLAGNECPPPSHHSLLQSVSSSSFLFLGGCETFFLLEMKQHVLK